MRCSTFLPQSGHFQPTYYSGCTGWYDGCDFNSYVLDGSNGASLWRDKSPIGLHVFQDVAGNRPIFGSNTLNGKPVLTFDGTSDRLFNATGYPTTTPQGIAVFAVVRYTSDATFRVIVDNNHGPGFAFQNTNANRLSAFSSTSPPIVVTSSIDVGDSTWRILSFSSISNFRTELRTNKTLNASLDHPSTALGSFNSVLSVGAWHAGGTPTRFFSGQLAELIIYRSPLDPAQIQRVENYLSEKWGLP